MGWNNSTKILTYPYTKLKSGGAGDLETAFGYTATSELALFKNGVWNKWAKFKYFKNSSTEINVTQYAAARKTANQGFVNFAFSSDMAACYNRAEATLADWEYDRPTSSMTDAQAAAYYPFRTFDFLNDTNKTATNVNGYNGNAKRPFEVATPVSAGGTQTQADFYVMWQYSVQELNLLDFAAFGDTYSGWRWIVMYKLPGQTSPSSTYIMTSPGGSTYVSVAAPSSSAPTLTGYFRLNLGSLTSGTVKAFLGLENTNLPKKYVYVPTGSSSSAYPGMSFTVVNPAAEFMFSWVWNAQQSGQTSPYKRGIEATLGVAPSGHNYFVTWATRIKIIAPSSGQTIAVKIQIGMRGYENGSYGNTFYVENSANVAINTTTFRDHSLPSSGTCYTDDFDNMQVSIRVTLGTQTPFYLDPMQSGDSTGKMGKLTYEKFRTIKEIRDFMGANAQSFIHSNLD